MAAARNTDASKMIFPILQHIDTAGNDNTADDRQHQQTQHIVEHGGAENDARHIRLLHFQFLQHHGGDTHTGGCQRGTEEQTGVQLDILDQQCRGQYTKQKR